MQLLPLPPPHSFFLLLLLLFSVSTNAHNITRILAKHPEFSTFNHYLTTTHLAEEINRRDTITVCAVDNAAMSDLLSKHYNLYTLKNVLSLHVFADYFGARKLHQITKGSTSTSTLYQATGKADGTSGYVTITDSKGGKVAFSAEDSHDPSLFVKSIEELPYNISVIQISNILSSPEAEAPTAGPADLNITSLMRKQGCTSFADLLKSSGAEETFTQNLEGGITVFCPIDETIKAFMPKFKNLTADQQVSLLLFHGIPIYESLGMLRSRNGLLNTLATEGSNKYDLTVQNDGGEDVKLDTKVVTAKITGTILDDEPLAVYKIDKVLLPRQLFHAAPPAPAPKGSSSSKKGKKDNDETAPGPDGSDDDDDGIPADSTASLSYSLRSMINGGYGSYVVGLSLCVGVLGNLFNLI